MKKYLMSLIILFLINIVIGSMLGPFKIFNILPSISLIILTVMSVNFKIEEAVIGAFTMGLLNDIFFGSILGLNMLLYLWLAIAIHFIAKEFLSNEPIIVLFITCGVILVYDSLMFLGFFLLDGKTYYFAYLFKTILPEIVYSLILYFPLSSLVLKYRRLVFNK